ncbi:GerAB/ArcD/ProY family transporter [Paenibacillus tundrae]|uniref:Spore germination protein (Amino acid permease) n=1 Tax=Paenibacillus tundrae TaxID=528187 RepID=A0ABT9WAG5_9BACL|nr:GerAB/ArcD/ProY family transporter [Paenibacillus tundrae]MDQ0169830.1 spore germination protein (amino acid permease) [Paenibacillus tundrae]
MNHLTAGQAYRFMFVYLYSEPIAFLLQRLFKMSGYQGWLSTIGGFLISLIFLFFTYRLGALNPDRPWLSFGEDIVGKWVHLFFVGMIALLCLYLVTIDVENFIIFLQSMYLPETPIWVTATLTLLCVSLSARSGLVTIIFMAEGIFLVQVLTSTLLIPTVGSGGNPDVLLSLTTHHDLGEIVIGSFSTLPWFSEWMLFLFLAPTVAFRRPLLRSMIFAGITVILFVVFFWIYTLMNFGPYVAASLRYPLLEMIRFARYGDFLDNLDPVLIAIWSTTMFTRSSFLLYVASVCLSKISGVRQQKSVVYLIGGTAAAIVMQYAKDVTAYELATRSYAVPMYTLLIESMPILYVIVHWLRYGKHRKIQPSSTSSS